MLKSHNSIKDSVQKAFSKKVNNIETIVNKHEQTLNNTSTSQTQLDRKLSQKLDSRFEALTKQVLGTTNDMQMTLTDKVGHTLENRNNAIEYWDTFVAEKNQK